MFMTGDPDKQTTRKKAMGAYMNVESIFIACSLSTAPHICFGMVNASDKLLATFSFKSNSMFLFKILYTKWSSIFCKDIAHR